MRSSDKEKEAKNKASVLGEIDKYKQEEKLFLKIKKNLAKVKRDKG